MHMKIQNSRSTNKKLKGPCLMKTEQTKGSVSILIHLISLVSTRLGENTLPPANLNVEPSKAAMSKSLYILSKTSLWSLHKLTISIFAIAMLTVSHGECHADLGCSIGWTICISTQGTMIPSKNAVEMLDYCDDFTRNNIGYRVLSLSFPEILKANEDYEKRTGQVISPLMKAHFSWKKLYDSDLRFDRRQTPSPAQYAQIKRSCAELHRNFYDDTKWKR